MRVIVLHDNPGWLEPIRTGLRQCGVEMEEWISDETCVDLSQPPPSDAIFYNRCSSSGHTRGRPRSLDQGVMVLRWLEQHRRVVVNGATAAELEGSKALQYMTAIKHGVGVPTSLVTVRPTAELIEKAIGKSKPFLIKPERGGGGHSIRFYNEVQEFLADPRPLESVTGLFVIQEFIPNKGGVYRAEFVGQRYLYTSVTQPDSSQCFDPNMCPREMPASRFRILTDFAANPIIPKIQEMFRATGVDNGAVEFIFDAEGVARVVDVNTNTLYNTQAEVGAGTEEGWKAVAQYICTKLKEEAEKVTQ